MAFGITPEGFIRPRLVDIKKEIEDALIATFGANIDLTPSSVFGQLVGIFAEREDLVWQGMEDVYNSQYPDTAFGASLDNVGALSGVPRLGALASTVAGQRLFGTAGTLVPQGTQFSVLGSPTSIFETAADVTLVAGVDCQQTLTFSATPTSGTWKLGFRNGETTDLAFNANAAAIQAALQALPFGAGITVAGTYGGGFTVTFAGAAGKQEQPALTIASNLLAPSLTIAVTITVAGQNQGAVNVVATVTGPIIANAGTLTVIVNPVSGLNSTINMVDAIVGRDVETDNAYRARRNQSLQVAGAGTLEAIRAQLLEVANVTAVIVFENDTDIPDVDGRPPHSFEAVVQGGADQDIWNKLWQVKDAGIRTDGDQVGTVIDSQGQSQTLRFSRPTDLPIYIKVTITTNPDFPAAGAAAAAQALVDAGNKLGIGKEVVVIPYLISSLASIPGIEDVVLLIGLTPSPTLSDNIPVAANQVATFDTGRTTVITI